LFEEYMVPRYKIVCDFLRSRGVNLICVDSDGDVRTLIPLWLRAGLNGIWPLEVQAGMDVVELRREYGNRLVMIGGIDKRVLSRNHTAIENEIERVWPVVEVGGYIPCTDHSIPPDVSWDNYRHYREYVAEKVGIETRS
jgi:uroporphyrinogen decarboxylase